MEEKDRPKKLPDKIPLGGPVFSILKKTKTERT